MKLGWWKDRKPEECPQAALLWLIRVSPFSLLWLLLHVFSLLLHPWLSGRMEKSGFYRLSTQGRIYKVLRVHIYSITNVITNHEI